MPTFRDCPNCNCGEGGRFIRKCADNHEFCTVCGAGPFGEFCPICDSRGKSIIGGVIGKIAFENAEDQDDEDDTEEDDDSDVEDGREEVEADHDGDGSDGGDYDDGSSYSYTSSAYSSTNSAESSRSVSSGAEGFWIAIVLIVIVFAVWSYSGRPAAPTSVPSASAPTVPPRNDVEIVVDGSAGAMVSLIGSMLGQETPAQIIDHGACPYEGCAYGTKWVASADTDGFEAPPRMLSTPPSSLQRVIVIPKGSWVTTVTGQVIAARRKGRVDFDSLRPSYRGDKGNGPPLNDGQSVAIYSYLGEGCYTSWIDGRAYVVCGLVAGAPTQEWWVQIVTANGARAWVDSAAFSRGSTMKRTSDAPAPLADAPSAFEAAGEVTEDVTISDTPQLTSEQENKRMNDMLNRATTPRIDPSRNALVFEQTPPDHFDKPVRSEYVEPVYPEIALREHLESEVTIEATIGPDGSVHDARVRGTRNDMFDVAALRAISQWKYAPARLNGEAVSVKMTAALRFSIEPKGK